MPVGSDALEQLPHARKRPRLGQIDALEQVHPETLEIAPLLLKQIGRQEGWHELIAAFAHLAADVLRIDLHAEAPEGFDPGGGMQIVGVDQRTVDIENDRYRAHGLKAPRNSRTDCPNIVKQPASLGESKALI